MVETHALSKLPQVVSFRPPQFKDSRGSFMETFREEWFAAKGLKGRFVQDNQSLSSVKGTLRGLHFQREPHAQGKLVRCVHGRIWDLAVDLRLDSETFGVWDALELTAAGGEQLYIPPGFAHGFVTLEEACLVAYKCTAPYNSAAEGAIHYADPELAILWPELGVPFAVSGKDAAAGSFASYRAGLKAP